jgi:Putative beta-barrel porin-2, OmpL-like. bbp2
MHVKTRSRLFTLAAVVPVLVVAGVWAAPAAAQQVAAPAAVPTSDQSPAQPPATATPAATATTATAAPAPADGAAAPADQTQHPEETKSYFTDTQVGGLVDVYYDYFSTKPEGDALFRNFDTRHNALRFSMAQLWIAKVPTADQRAGYKVKLNFGHSATMINAYEPSKTEALKNFEEGYFSYLAPLGKGLQFDVGKFVTQHGAEVIEAKDNWNYSRSLLFALAIPYYHTGVRATYTINDKVSVMGALVNGWNDFKDNNSGKTFGAQVTIKPLPALTIVQNYMTGPEQAHTNDNWRQLSDSIVTVTVNPALSLMANYDYGHDNIAGVSGHWQGIAGYAKYQANKWITLSPRFEVYDDAAGLTTGAVQTLKELTGTVEVKTTIENLLCRLEYRSDFSDQPVFTTSEGLQKKTQNSFGIGVLYSISFKGK